MAGIDTLQAVKVSSLPNLQGEYLPALCLNSHMAKSLPDIANRLILLRAALGKKPADIVRETKITASQWSEYEAGNRTITITQARKLKRVYGVTLDWIFDDDPRGLSVDLHEKLYSPDTRAKVNAA